MSELPKGWIETSIQEIVLPFETIDPGKSPEEYFTYIDIGSIDNIAQEIGETKQIVGKDAPSRARRIVKRGDTLFSTVRTYLKNIALVPEVLHHAITSTGIAVLRPSRVIDPKYLFNWTRSAEFLEEIGTAMDGTMYPAVADRDVFNARILLPPLAEQCRIVAKLDSLFTRTRRAREELSKIPRLIEHYRDTVFDQLFDPQWPKILLNDIVSFGPQNGLYLPKTAYGSGCPILRIENYGFQGAEDRILWKRVEISHRADHVYDLKPGDIIINRVNSPSHLGKSLLITDQHVPAVFESNMIRFRVNEDVLPEFVQIYLSTRNGRAQLTKNAKWAVNQASINQGDVLSTSIPLPIRSEQCRVIEKYRRLVVSLISISDNCSKAQGLLDHLDQANLAKAFQGELVPQDPNDEPASALLDRIRAERDGQLNSKSKRSFK